MSTRGKSHDTQILFHCQYPPCVLKQKCPVNHKRRAVLLVVRSDRKLPDMTTGSTGVSLCVVPFRDGTFFALLCCCQMEKTMNEKNQIPCLKIKGLRLTTQASLYYMHVYRSIKVRIAASAANFN
jgi:hypothetical protein